MAERKFLLINATYGYHEEHNSAADDTFTMLGLTIGTSGITMGGNDVSGLPTTPPGSSSAVSLAYLESVSKWKPPVSVINIISDADQSAADPIYPVAGDAYVVNNWATQDNGDIVEWDGAAWNVIVANSGSEPPTGTRVVVTAGTPAGSFVSHDGDIATYNATSNTWTFEDPEENWTVMVSGADSIYKNEVFTYNATGTTWVQFVSVGNGLTKTGNQINLVLDNTPDTLDVDADGLKVVGLPSLFKINDDAVSSNVTANNLDELTGGGATTLHSHSTGNATEAPLVELTLTNNATVTTGQVVRWSAVASKITPAAPDSDANASVIGVARTGGAEDETSEVVRTGICTSVLSGATVNTAYYLGTSGALVLFGAVPVPGRLIRMGYASNATDLDVQIFDYGWRR